MATLFGRWFPKPPLPIGTLLPKGQLPPLLATTICTLVSKIPYITVWQEFPGHPYPSFHLVVIDSIRFDFAVFAVGLGSRLECRVATVVRQLCKRVSIRVFKCRDAVLKQSRRVQQLVASQGPAHSTTANTLPGAIKARWQLYC